MVLQPQLIGAAKRPIVEGCRLPAIGRREEDEGAPRGQGIDKLLAAVDGCVVKDDNGARTGVCIDLCILREPSMARVSVYRAVGESRAASRAWRAAQRRRAQ